MPALLQPAAGVVVPADVASSPLRVVTTTKSWNHQLPSSPTVPNTPSTTEKEEEHWILEKRILAAEKAAVHRGSSASVARDRAVEEHTARQQLGEAEARLRDALQQRIAKQAQVNTLLQQRAALQQEIAEQRQTVEDGAAAQQATTSLEVVAAWVRTDVASSRHRNLELNKAIAELRAAHQE